MKSVTEWLQQFSVIARSPEGATKQSQIGITWTWSGTLSRNDDRF